MPSEPESWLGFKLFSWTLYVLATQLFLLSGPKQLQGKTWQQKNPLWQYEYINHYRLTIAHSPEFKLCQQNYAGSCTVKSGSDGS